MKLFSKQLMSVVLLLTNAILFGLILGVNLPTPQVAAQGLQCSFVQANCSWDAVSGATQYRVTVTEVDTNTVIKNETVTGTKYVFPVTQNRTYRCDVAAVNSCGQAGTAGTDELLCSVDAAVNTPTNTPSPTRPPGATSTPTLTRAPTATPIIITKTPPPTLPPMGTVENTMMFGAGAAVLIIIGGLLFIL
jgi:hypothetical protein